MTTEIIIQLTTDGALFYPHLDSSKCGVLVSTTVDGWVVARWDGMDYVTFLPVWTVHGVDMPQSWETGQMIDPEIEETW